MYKVELSEYTDDDGRTTLTITDDGDTRSYIDGGEPEDNVFYRDWNWVSDELNKAYRQGVIDGGKQVRGES
jgi:hypothetical protein